MGCRSIVDQPGILAALNPVYAYSFFAINHLHGIVALASVVLCITGCEALYADMGHFGRLPIRLTWYLVVLPGLVLNYFGQCALLLQNPDIADGQPLLRPGAEIAALSPGRARHPVHHHRLPGHDFRRLFAHPAGHATGVHTAHAHRPHLRTCQRPDIYADPSTGC